MDLVGALSPLMIGNSKYSFTKLSKIKILRITMIIFNYKKLITNYTNSKRIERRRALKAVFWPITEYEYMAFRVCEECVRIRKYV